MIEILLAIAVIAIIAGIMTPIFLSSQVRNDIDVATLSLVRSIRRAEQLSRNGEGDSAWGVNLSSGEILIFKGPSYIGRDSSFDESFSIPNNISFSGTSSVVFNKFSGLPSASGTINLTSINNETRVININSKGSVDY